MKIVITHSEILIDGMRLEMWNDDDELVDVRESKMQPLEGHIGAIERMIEGITEDDMATLL